MQGNKLRVGFISDYLTSEYVDNLINGISTFCSENDIRLFIFQIGDFHKKNPTFTNFEFASVTAFINSNNLDGIIIASSALLHSVDREEYMTILKDFAPLKIVNIASEIPGVPSVVADFEDAFDSLIQYLIEVQGCKRFGFMGVDSQTPEVIQRTEIFNRVLARNGIPKDNIVQWKTNFEYSSAYRKLTEYRREHGVIDFDAIVALNDEMAFACSDFCIRRMKMMVPNDILITGFDNLQRATFNNPTITSVNQQIEFIGYTAANTLYKQLKGKEVPPVQRIKAKTILRQSTAKNKEAQKNFHGNNFISIDSRTSRDFSTSFSVSEWFNKRTQILQAANFQNSIDANVIFDTLPEIITNSLRGFGFQAAAIITYDRPIEATEPFDYFKLPSKARFFAGFDYEKTFNIINFPEPIYFNPNDSIVPSQYFHFTSEGSIITALYSGYIHYGYLILRCNKYDLGVYDLMQRALSNILATSYNYTQMVAEKTRMTSQNHELNLIAHTDELTGLRNRRGFMELGQSTLALSQSREETGLVVFCDMDGLKTINDTFGHETGDTAIKAQSEILNNCFRSNDILGRCGGDEFLVICPGLTMDKFGKIRERISKACHEWSRNTKAKFELSISLGAVAYPNPDTGYDMDALLANADEMLYNEKREKKERKFKLKLR